MLVTELPQELLLKILDKLSYDDVSKARGICRLFDALSKQILNLGFHKVEEFQSRCLQNVKSRLPRRESERRTHALARHSDILTAIETRLSLLSMTFTKYMDNGLCCFIPGKVLDEIYRVLRQVQVIPPGCDSAPRPHEILQELRDISSMAMEYFDERIVPTLRDKSAAHNSHHSFANRTISIGISSLSDTCLATTSAINAARNICGTSGISGSILACKSAVNHIIKDHQSQQKQLQEQQQQQQQKATEKQVKSLTNQVTTLTKEVKSLHAAYKETKQKLEEQSKLVVEQNAKIDEVNRKMLEYDHRFAELFAEFGIPTAIIPQGLPSAVSSKDAPGVSASRASARPGRHTKPVGAAAVARGGVRVEAAAGSDEAMFSGPLTRLRSKRKAEVFPEVADVDSTASMEVQAGLSKGAKGHRAKLGLALGKRVAPAIMDNEFDLAPSSSKGNNCTAAMASNEQTSSWSKHRRLR